jgi:hypothetical protein
MSNDNQLKSFAISTIILKRKHDTYHLLKYNVVTLGQQLYIYTKRYRNYSFAAVSLLGSSFFEAHTICRVVVNGKLTRVPERIDLLHEFDVTEILPKKIPP